ncbi:MAG: peptidase [Gammaproteobacteria bacterium]|nr:MAG: peptidase [Gammaproteobacteria bacterium]
MHWILLIALVALVIAGPQWWVRRTLNRYSAARDNIPGTGGELAQHLFKRLELANVKLLTDSPTDHYDPINKQVCLTPAVADQRSLTAIVVAAHEVGHAIQDATGYAPLRWRTHIARLYSSLEKFGGVLLLAIPVVILVTRVPQSGLIMLLLAVGSTLGAVLLSLITLPVELDASFNRTLPLLEAGNYVSAKDLPAARKILTACALTYFAASLISMFNAWRWMRYARR